MNRTGLPLALLLLALGAPAALPGSSRAYAAGLAGNVCGRGEVLDRVREHLGGQLAQFALLDDAATEIRTSGPFVVCGIKVRIELHAADLAGPAPVFLVQPRYFQVQSLAGGFEIDFGGD